jgi:hypothetical protein
MLLNMPSTTSGPVMSRSPCAALAGPDIGARTAACQRNRDGFGAGQGVRLHHGRTQRALHAELGRHVAEGIARHRVDEVCVVDRDFEALGRDLSGRHLDRSDFARCRESIVRSRILRPREAVLVGVRASRGPGRNRIEHRAARQRIEGAGIAAVGPRQRGSEARIAGHV